ncbi:MAG: hypothetical protein GXP62_03150 [Oligoflexia bacterium]|nr:hypothetical protein [Oligoflexia bacterium]
MLPVYLGSLCLGGVLILASLILGGSDHDIDHDVDHDLDLGGDLDTDVDIDVDADVDVDVDADAGLDGGLDHDLDHDLGQTQDLQHQPSETGSTWLPFLSLRFWTFALATFGGSGTLLDLLGFSDMATVPSALVTGLGVGLAVSWAFHRLKNDNVTGDIGLRQVSGREGHLLLSVGPDKLGKVRVRIDGQDVDLLARTQDATSLPIREKVLVVRVEDGIAHVTSLQPDHRERSR